MAQPTVPTDAPRSPRGDAGTPAGPRHAAALPVEATPPKAPPVEPEFSRAYTSYALGLLLVVYIFNFVDRQILTILLPAIKQDFAFTDTQLALLGGVAFGIFYATLGIPIARWADSGSRKTIISLSVVTWSLMTALTGRATGFATLFFARVGVGVGEAGCTPPAQSMISDYLPPHRRATALSIYALGVPLGTGVGLAIGGLLADQIGWRMTFVVVGLPGVVVGLLAALTLREPTRGYWERGAKPASAPAGSAKPAIVPTSAGAHPNSEKPDVMYTLRYMLRFPSFRHLSLAAALHAMYGYGAVYFNPSFFVRVFDLEASRVGIYLGMIAFAAGGTGTYLGGAIGDWLQHRDRRWYVWVPAISTISIIPFIAAVYLNADPTWAFWLSVLPAIAGGMYLGPTFAMTQALAKPAMRSVAAAILLFVITMIGLGLGPLVVGALSDLLTPDYGKRGIAYALLLVVSLCATWSTVHYAIAARTLRADLERA
jgi:MFS family permease